MTGQKLSENSYTINSEYDNYNSTNGTSFENLGWYACGNDGRLFKTDGQPLQKYITLRYNFDLSKLRFAQLGQGDHYLELFFESKSVTLDNDGLDKVWMYNDELDTKYTYANHKVLIPLRDVPEENKRKLIKALNHLKKLVDEEKEASRKADPFGN